MPKILQIVLVTLLCILVAATVAISVVDLSPNPRQIERVLPDDRFPR